MKRGEKGNSWHKLHTSFKEAMGPIEFFNKSKRTLGGNEMDTLDLGKQNIFTTLLDAMGILDNISCLNELYSIPSCSEQ